MTNSRQRLILFARYPEAGKVKTRLIPALGPDGAASVHRRLVLHTLRTSREFCAANNVELEIRFDGANEAAMDHWLGRGPLYRAQSEGDLGARMANAFQQSVDEGSVATVVIGSDCPCITKATLAAAFEALSGHDVVFGPATDGGYYLIGLKQPVPELFSNMTWGTDTVLHDSLQALERTGLSHCLLEQLDDIDRPEDVQGWRKLVTEEEASTRVSIIMPALNEAAHIADSIASARRGNPHEIIVVDGGSSDETCKIALDADATVLNSQRGRARQMNAGAAGASGNVLLFLHADTQLPEGWMSEVHHALQHDNVAVGAFPLMLTGEFTGRRLVEWGINSRSRLWQEPYGDQGFFLRRAFFEEAGGFANMPLLEDVEFIRRVRSKGRVVIVSKPILTSGRRWKELGVLRTTLINQVILTAYRCGIAPQKLAQLYAWR